MKKIEHYCSAVNQIMHEPKPIEEVIQVKQEKKDIKMTKSGRAFGAAVAAALVCANIAGGYWLFARDRSLTAPAASAPGTSIAIETTEPAAAPVTAQAPAETVSFAEEKPGFGATICDGFSMEEMDRLEGIITENVTSAEEADAMFRSMCYYAGNAVLKKNGTTVFDGRTAVTHVVPISNLNGFTLEISPEGVEVQSADCELFINVCLMKPTDPAATALLEQKETLLSRKIMLSGSDTVTLPLELHSENESGVLPAAEAGDTANWMLEIELSYRPRVCENEADEGGFDQTVLFAVTTDGTNETTYTPAELDERYPFAQAVDDKEPDETKELPEEGKPQDQHLVQTDDENWYGLLCDDALKYDTAFTDEMNAIIRYYAENSALMLNGKELTGMDEPLTSLDGLTFEIRPDAEKPVPGACEAVISAFIMPSKEAQFTQLKNKAGEKNTNAKLNGSESVSIPVELDIDNPADGSVLQVEIAFHPIVDDEDVIDMARGYSFILNLTK